ncbi:hypothetical protein AB8B12_33910, partial [Streptomyces sp. PGLac3x]
LQAEQPAADQPRRTGDTPEAAVSGDPAAVPAAPTAVLFQALLDAEVDAPLWCLTRGAVAVAGSEAVTAPPPAPPRGQGRVAARGPTRGG